jgi:hypothetical protein
MFYPVDAVPECVPPASPREAGRGHVKCPRCRLTFPPPGFARQAWKGATHREESFPAACPHCGHADGFSRRDAIW